MLRSNSSKYFSILAAALFVLTAAGEAAQAQVCLKVDEARDTLSPKDRAAAVLLLAKQFELAGKHVVPDCPTPYAVGHITLGNVITVTLSGSEGQREGTAKGLNDLPALYGQLVRSLITGRGVLDRTNITGSQASTNRVHSDSLFYARLGYGSLSGDRTYGMPALGFGHRSELDSFAIDVSFNLQTSPSSGSSLLPTSTGSLKLEGLRFVHPKANATPYIGGGLSWGGTSFGVARKSYGTSNYAVSSYAWEGSGLQGEMTAGYELGRTTTLRWFLQVDATLPFYRVKSTLATTDRRYAPSSAFTVGVAWQRNRN